MTTIGKPARALIVATTLAAALSLTACGNSSSKGLIDSATPTGASSGAASSGAVGAWQASNCSQVAAPSPVEGPVGQLITTGISVEQAAPADAPVIAIQSGTPAATELGGFDLIPGTGPEVAAGATVTGNYCGVGLTSGAVFDSSWARGQEASFPLSGVIQGWAQGLPGMKVGGTRVLVIPGDLAYGANPPQGSSIAPNETLVFVVSLSAAQ